MIARKAVLNRLSILSAGATLLLGGTLWTTSRSQSIDKPDTPLKVALVLDCITQPRFQEDMKNFGMSRMLPVAGGHLMAGELSLPTQKDRDLFKTAETSHRDFLIGFIHCAHVPGSMPRLGGASGERAPGRAVASADRSRLGLFPGETPSSVRVSPVCNRLRHLYATQVKTAQKEESGLYGAMTTAAQKALPKLMKGQGAEQDTGDWLVVTRPVRAMKTSCLKCHEGAKLGDTLGALAYAVSKQTFAAVLPTTRSRSTTGYRGGF